MDDLQAEVDQNGVENRVENEPNVVQHQVAFALEELGLAERVQLGDYNVQLVTSLGSCYR